MRGGLGHLCKCETCFTFFCSQYVCMQIANMIDMIHVRYVHLRCQQRLHCPFPGSFWECCPRFRSTAGQIHLVGRRGRRGECRLTYFQGKYLHRNVFREISEKYFQRNIFKYLLSDRYFQRNIFREALSERCPAYVVDHICDLTKTGWVDVTHTRQVMRR